MSSTPTNFRATVTVINEANGAEVHMGYSFKSEADRDSFVAGCPARGHRVQVGLFYSDPAEALRHLSTISNTYW